MSNPELPAPGQALADFAGPSTAGPWRLADQHGHWVVLYFYPKDNTPGCTTESVEFARCSGQFQARGARIVGVSRDALASHERFAARFELPFPLLSDPDEQVCSRFGVMKQKNMYGKQVRGIERSTFLIDPTGVLRVQWRGVKVPGHVDAVLAALQDLTGKA
jgi:peroxiredoxin Q/BCP